MEMVLESSNNPYGFESSEMEAINIPVPVKRFDALINECCQCVFNTMIDERARLASESLLVGSGAEGEDLFRRIGAFQEGYCTVGVGYVGEAKGLVSISVPTLLVEIITIKLVDPMTDKDIAELLMDVLGEIGNSFVGLVKSGLTRLFPDLKLTVPQTLSNRRFNIGETGMSFRKQYQYAIAGHTALVDFCHSQSALYIGN